MLWYSSKSHMAPPEFRTSFYSKTWKFRPPTLRTSQWQHGKVSSTHTHSPLILWTQFWDAAQTSEKSSAASTLLKPLGREDAQHGANMDSEVHFNYVPIRLTGWIFKLSELSQISPVSLTARLSAVSSVKIIFTLKWNGSIPCWLHSTCKN